MDLDCDDAMLLIAARTQRTLGNHEAAPLAAHLEGCDACRTLAVDPETSEDWRWVARMPQDAFEDADLLVFPVVDPIVFQSGKVVASGGMGRITRVTDRRLGREVALKESLEGTVRSRFEREAAITARLQHPSIVPIYEAGSWPDGSLFYTMRLVDGEDLAAAIGKTSSLPERIALLPHVVKVTEALAYAHARRIIHRDLKPANVLVGAYGETVVIDWGIAKELDRTIDDLKLPQLPSSGELTRQGVILGTPCFMPPEQARGAALDERADVYALGALLYNLLVGEPPYWDRFQSAELIIEYSILHPPTPIRVLAPDAPTDLCAIVERAMARAPADRYRDAGEMAAELRRFEAGQLIAREYTLRELAARWLAKHRTSVVIAAIAMSVLAVIAVIAVINVRASRDAEAVARRDAEANLAAARVAAAAALEEQARTEVLDGDRTRGFAYAAAAYAQGRDTPSLRYLLGVASRDAVIRTAEIGPPELTASCGKDRFNCIGRDVEAAAYTRDGDAILVESTGRISAWRDGKRLRWFPLGKEVTTAAIDPAVRRAAVFQGPDQLAMWDLAGGATLWSIREPTLDGLRVIVRFSSDGKYVLAVSDHDHQRALAVRDAATGAVVAELVVGKREISAAAFSPDGTRVAACDPNGDVKAWTIAPFRELAAWKADPEPATLVFVGNDRIALDANFPTGRTVSIWELGTPAHLIKVLPPHAGPIVALAAAPDGKALATSDATTLWLWGPDGNPLGESKIARSRFDDLTMTFTRTALIGSAIDSRLFVFERSTLAPRAVVAAHNSMIASIAVDGAATKILTAGDGDQRVHEWTMPRGPELARFAGDDATWFRDRIAVATRTGIAWYAPDGTPDGRTELALDGGAELTVAGDRLLVHGKHGQFAIDAARTARPIAETTKLVPSSDGRYALAADADDDPPADGLRVWDLERGTLVRTLEPKRWTEAVIVGATVVVSYRRRLSIYDIATGTKLANTQLPESTYRLAVSRSDKVVLAYNMHSIVRVDPATGSEQAQLPSPSDINELFLAADDQLALTNTETGTWAWDLPTGRLITQIDRRTGVYAVTADGLIAIGDDHQVRIVSRATGRQLDAIDVVAERIRRIEASPDGSRLLIATAAEVVVLDIHRETRAPAAIEALAERLPWKLEEGVAVPR